MHTVVLDTRVVTGTGASGEAFIAVSDTGGGIAPENRAKLFQPFFTTKPEGQGTGLGLSICAQLVAQYGGRIEVDSEVGVGTTFRVLLPREPSGDYQILTTSFYQDFTTEAIPPAWSASPKVLAETYSRLYRLQFAEVEALGNL